jgi:hypothetical protein
VILCVNEVNYSFVYYPYYRIKQDESFHLYGMRLPSGNIEHVRVLNIEHPIQALREFSEHLIREYVLEDDDMLTPKAQNFKNELKELLCYDDKK